jgi:polyisoprenoid-binding protein YceI
MKREDLIRGHSPKGETTVRSKIAAQAHAPVVTALLLLLLAAIAGTPPAAVAQPAAPPDGFKVDPVHSSVAFTIRHFVSEVEGRFKDFAGTIRYDSQHPADSSVQFTVQAASIDTDNEARDKDLRSEHFFDVEKFPTLSFTSTKVTPKGANAFDVTGNLTIHGVTKTVTIPATLGGTIKSAKGAKAGFQSSFKINRMDYGVTWNSAIEGGGTILGTDVNVTIRVEANQPAPGAAR